MNQSEIKTTVLRLQTDAMQNFPIGIFVMYNTVNLVIF